jgi:predicted CXXCH cytochrome family protein
MRGAWPKGLAWPLVAGLGTALAVGRLLLAQAAGQNPSAPAQPDRGPAAATRPADAAPSSEPAATQPGPDEAPLTAARERLVGGLRGSKHDFTQDGRMGRDLCLPCHTPHLLAPPAPRLDRRAATTQPLRPYQAVGLKLDGWSLLCLGCHDGVTAPDVYSSAHAVAVTNQLAGSRLGERGLRSHPVGIEYPASNDSYHKRAAVQAAGLTLPDGRIQCTTCHDAHNTYRHTRMLRTSDERSRLCLTCHRV